MLATIRVRLILLALIVAIPLVAANLFVIDRLASEQAEAQKHTLIATTRALAAAVDAELKKYAVVGHSLATSVPLEEGNTSVSINRHLKPQQDSRRVGCRC
jgi:hypothetical protein